MRHRGKAIILSLLVAATAVPQQTNPPVITALNPTSIVARSPGFTLSLTGANFLTGAQVRVNTSVRPTQFVDSRRLTVSIPSTDLLTVRALSITAANPGTLPSGAVQFQVVSNIPSITSINPSIVPAGSDAFTLTVTGSGYANTATVRVNGIAVSTTFVSEMQLTAVIPASELRTARNLGITVFNPSPFNQTSNVVQLTVSNTVPPSITILDPSSVVAGSPGFTLSIFGMNFASNASVKINDLPAPTTFVNSTRVTTPISASQIATARTLNITATNPTTRLTSPAATLTVTVGNLPAIDSINPESVQAVSGPLTLAVTGTNFIPSSIVRFNGFNRTTAFVDALHLTASLPAADLTTEATHQISVFNPPPNGGTSESVTLTVFSEFAPVITSLDPANFPTLSQSLKLTVTGFRFGFFDNNVVLVDDFPRETEFVNNTTLVATLFAEDVAVPGTHSVKVTNKNGFTSAAETFTVSDQAGPVISTLTPSSAGVGDPPFTLILTGTNFVQESIVTIDATPRTTTFVSPTQLEVQITSADLSSPREMAITVLNPDGLASTPLRLKVNLVPPTIVSLSPPEAIGGDTGFTLFITGTRFSETSIVRLNGVIRTPTFDALTGRLLVPITAADLAVSGTIAVTVTGVGGTSAAATLTVMRPRITAVTPSAIPTGSNNVTLIVEGVGFLPTSRIVFLGVARETTLLASGALSTTLNATDLSIPVEIGVRVQNAPAVVSEPFLIIVGSPGDPRIDALEPGTIVAGTSSAQVSVRGANFLSGAVVRVNGVAKPTQFVSSNELVVTLSASDLAATGTLEVTVRNPDGTTTAVRQLTIVSAPPPGGPRRRGVRR